ncbi:MAG: PspC domain-containing protein [Chloroflexaceae bacterium]|nr:PspC domain-containing protein [Chloroflexaceae bacterium]
MQTEKLSQEETPTQPGSTTPSRRRIVRSRRERLIAGVSGGLAAYFHVDPLLVRLGFVVLSLFQGFGIVLYLLLWFLVPSESSHAPDSRSQICENVSEMQGFVQKGIARLRDLFRNQDA